MHVKLYTCLTYKVDVIGILTAKVQTFSHLNALTRGTQCRW